MIPVPILLKRQIARSGLRSCSSLREEEIFRGLLPFVSIDDRLEDQAKLKNELAQRNRSANIDELIHLWQQYKCLNAEIEELEARRLLVTAEVKKGNVEARKEGKNLREWSKGLAKKFVATERLAVPAALALPVPLAPNFVGQCPTSIRREEKGEQTDADSSIVVGRRLKILDWRNKWSYFLLGRAAQYELAAPMWLFSRLESTGVKLMSGVDLCRPALADAIPINGSPSLTTGASVQGVAATATAAAPLARCVIPANALPLHWISIGRRYILPDDSLEDLNNVVQRHSAHALLVGSSKQEAETVVSATWEALSKLGLDIEFRVAAPSDLAAWEAGRIDIVTESLFSKRHICLGSLSDLGEHSARRLRTYAKHNTEEPLTFPHLYAGTLLDVPALLTCVLEHGDNKASELLDKHLAIFKNR